MMNRFHTSFTSICVSNLAARSTRHAKSVSPFSGHFTPLWKAFSCFERLRYGPKPCDRRSKRSWETFAQNSTNHVTFSRRNSISISAKGPPVRHRLTILLRSGITPEKYLEPSVDEESSVSTHTHTQKVARNDEKHPSNVQMMVKKHGW